MANKPFWIKRYGKSNEFPNADLIDQLGFYVPNHQDLTEIEIQLVASIINGEYVG
jgi:hypothetical protein